MPGGGARIGGVATLQAVAEPARADRELATNCQEEVLTTPTRCPDEMKHDDIHPDSLDLIAHARGALQGAEAQAVGLHCVLCDRCRSELEAMVLLRRFRALPVRAPGRARLLMPSVVTVQ